MKKIKWGAVLLGIISNVGIITIGVVGIAFLWALLAASIVGADGLRYIMRQNNDLPFLITFFVFLIGIGATILSGWITALLSRPNGLYNAMVLAGIFAAFSLLGGLGGFGILRILLPFPLCWFGAMFAPKSKY